MNLEERVATLEKSARMWRLSTFVIAAGLVGTFLIGAVKPPSGIVQTKKLVILNADNVPAAVVTTDSGGAGLLQLSNTNGAVLFEASAKPEGGFLKINYPTGDPAATVGTPLPNTAEFQLWNNRTNDHEVHNGFGVMTDVNGGHAWMDGPFLQDENAHLPLPHHRLDLFALRDSSSFQVLTDHTTNWTSLTAK